METITTTAIINEPVYNGDLRASRIGCRNGICAEGYLRCDTGKIRN